MGYFLDLLFILSLSRAVSVAAELTGRQAVTVVTVLFSAQAVAVAVVVQLVASAAMAAQDLWRSLVGENND